MKLSQLPNAICILRMLLVVPIVMTLLTGRTDWTLGLFLLAGFSDKLDGFLARSQGWQSEIGALLDPLADKLLLVCVFITLAWLGLVPLWLTAVVILRDVIIVTGALLYHALVGPVQGEPSLISKVNTLLQLFFVILVVAASGYAWPPELLVALTGAAVFVSAIISGIDYIRVWGIRAARQLTPARRPLQ